MKKWRTGVLLALCLLLSACGGQAAVSSPVELKNPPKYVALTFDDGPRQETTSALLDGLLEREAKATFFLIGEEIEHQEDLVKRMAAEGHQVGNHSWSHKNLKELSPEDAALEIGRTDQALQKVLGEGSYWLRPPYGLPNPKEPLNVPIIRWNVDPRDWESRDTEAVYQHVLSHVKPDSIILLHDIYETSVDAALRLLDTLGEQGYRFVTVEELLAQNGVTPQAGKIYSSGKADE